MAMTVSKTKDELKQTFIGLCTCRWSKTSAKLSASTTWDFELPILRDSISFDNPDPSLNKVFIHGERTPYAISSEPSDITLTFEIPSIKEELRGWLYEEGEAIASIADNVNGKAGNWAGKGIKFTDKPINGMLMLISEDGKSALVIKNLQGYATLNMNEISSSPVSFTITATLVGGVSTDTDGDVAFLQFTETPGGE